MTYPPDRLMEEVGYVAYHFHWGLDELLDLEHPTRLRFVDEIAKINRRMQSASAPEEQLPEGTFRAGFWAPQ